MADATSPGGMPPACLFEIPRRSARVPVIAPRVAAPGELAGVGQRGDRTALARRRAG
jgi:hypothetical protein